MFILAYDPCKDFRGVVQIVGLILTVIQWVVPIILILLGTIDLVKSVIAGKEDDIKKNQTTLIKRVIAAVIVFLVPIIVGILMGMIGKKGAGTWSDCWNKHRNEGVSGLFSNEIK